MSYVKKTPMMKKLIHDAEKAGYTTTTEVGCLNIYKLDGHGKISRGIVIYPDMTGYDATVPYAFQKTIRGYKNWRELLRI